MARAVFLLCLLGASIGTPASARDAITVVRDWGAFRDEDPVRCFAIAEPPPGAAAPDGSAWAAVSSWPARRLRAQVSLKLSRGHRRAAPVTLTIGDSAFRLMASDRTAWAHDRRQDAAIVAAMRSGSSMSVSTIAPEGRPYADVYRLRGAATAIDAAMLACPMQG